MSSIKPIRLRIDRKYRKSGTNSVRVTETVRTERGNHLVKRTETTVKFQ